MPTPDLLHLSLSLHPQLPLVLTIGSNEVRKVVYDKFTTRPWATMIHPTASVAPDAEVGIGAIIEPFVIIGSGATVGKFAVLGNGAYVGAGAYVGDYTFVGVGAVIAAGATIEDISVVGTGAVVCANVHVGASGTVTVGSLAVDDVPAHFVVSGSPARPILKRLRTKLR